MASDSFGLLPIGSGKLHATFLLRNGSEWFGMVRKACESSELAQPRPAIGRHPWHSRSSLPIVAENCRIDRDRSAYFLTFIGCDLLRFGAIGLFRKLAA